MSAESTQYTTTHNTGSWDYLGIESIFVYETLMQDNIGKEPKSQMP